MAISQITASGVATDTLTAADLAPNSVDSSELVDGSIDTSHIGDDQVTGDKLANDIAISTTGAITTTGAFTSVGIDDNASGAVAITIDSSENVGIGTTAIGTSSHNFGGQHNLTLGGATANSFSVLEIAGNDADDNAYIGGIEFVNKNNSDAAAGTAEGVSAIISKVETDDSNAGDDSGGHLQFWTKPNGGNLTDRMIIDSSGKVGIGTTSPDAVRLEVKSTGGSTEEAFIVKDVNNNKVFVQTGGGGAKFTYGPLTIGNSGTWAAGSNVCLIEASGITNVSRSGSGTNTMMGFYNANGGVGTIKTSGSSTSYNTSSDYRLKENVVLMSGSVDRLKNLKPSRFNFKADADKTVDGFLAHEAQEVVPESVTGTKDGMTETILYVEGDELPEGKSIGDVKTASVPDMQGIDQSKLVPLLVGALQEAITRIEALESA